MSFIESIINVDEFINSTILLFLSIIVYSAYKRHKEQIRNQLEIIKNSISPDCIALSALVLIIILIFTIINIKLNIINHKLDVIITKAHSIQHLLSDPTKIGRHDLVHRNNIGIDDEIHFRSAKIYHMTTHIGHGSYDSEIYIPIKPNHYGLMYDNFHKISINLASHVVKEYVKLWRRNGDVWKIDNSNKLKRDAINVKVEIYTHYAQRILEEKILDYLYGLHDKYGYDIEEEFTMRIVFGDVFPETLVSQMWLIYKYNRGSSKLFYKCGIYYIGTEGICNMRSVL